MTPNVVTCAQAAGSSVLDPDRRSGSGVVIEFSTRYISYSYNKVIRVSPGTMLWEQALTIKLDRLVYMRWFSLAREKHLSMYGVCLAMKALGWRR